jgi:phosphoglucosamine mutase
LQVLSAIKRSGQTLAEQTADLTLFPQTLINVKIQRGFEWQQHGGLKQACAQVEDQLGGDGRILIRASGTEPLLRVMVEARDDETAQRHARYIADSLGV